ncbi:response regulator transcription factor [Streptomyces spirodelae]|uniref:Response regulator transcription factor n=1 Tax=Streptomyces spirodelae TaxID=2812904 RepID=A0ABS3WWL3_9ACTN|nr:response regulator transcription factor [Streptomyces spirodelae]MBO8187515.1 response regulator transcription factor [Streptomyces spirodelae]
MRLIILDDDPVYRMGVAAAAEIDSAVTVVAQQGLPERCAGRMPRPPAELVAQADVVLVGGPGPARLARTVRLLTATDPAVRVLVASDDGSTAAVLSVVRSGAMGYVMKSVSARTLLRSVHLLAEGGAAFGAGVAEGLRGGLGMLPQLSSRLAFPTLTERERDILELLALGWENKRIARRLVLAEKTVRNHITGLFRKLEVPDRNAAMMRARAAGIGLEHKAAEV